MLELTRRREPGILAAMFRRVGLVSKRIFFLIALLGSTEACAPSAKGAQSPIGSTAAPELATLREPEAQDARATPPDDAVPQAERPFFGYRLADGKRFPAEDLLTTLAAADGVCIGERHDEVLDHYAELRLITGFLERRQMRGFELGVGLEMLRAEDQIAVTAFEHSNIDAEEFLERVDWEQEWGFPSQYYMPQLVTARTRGARLLALGVAQRVTRRIAETGLEGLGDYERGRLPPLDFTSQQHRKIFDELMAGHPGAERIDLDRYYEAQIVWDESMAQTSANWLTQRRPGRKIVILAGTAHCHRDAIPSRIEVRTGLRIVGLLPVVGGTPISAGSDGSVDELIAQGYEYQMVFEP